MIEAIETEYKGYRFRSRLEARWAVFFDEMGMKWVYEPEGFKMSDGTLYLPDFYLPDAKEFFEVKGILSDKDIHKINQLMKETGVPVAVGFDGMEFVSPDNYGDFEIDSFKPSSCDFLVRCRRCGQLYFIGDIGSYSCTACDYYDGGHTFRLVGEGTREFDAYDVYSDDEDLFLKAIEKAKQARFEHGEKG